MAGDSEADLPSFLSFAYKTLGSVYPKFYKMDLLSKMGLLTADILLEGGVCRTAYQDDEIAVIVCNSQSSLETDARFLATMTDPASYFPSPALFVYTLPNILIGEICIKLSISGESVFFVSQQVDFDFLQSYVDIILQTTRTKAVIVGWVDLDFNHNYESILFFVEEKSRLQKEKPSWSFTSRTFSDLYSQKNLSQDA